MRNFAHCDSISIGVTCSSKNGEGWFHRTLTSNLFWAMGRDWKSEIWHGGVVGHGNGSGQVGVEPSRAGVRVLKAPLLEDFSGILKEEILVRVLRYLKGCLALDGCAGARPSDAGTWLQISPLM